MARRPHTLTLALAALTLAAAGPTPAPGQSVPLDTTTLADGPSSRACMLLERTIFQVDVLTLDVRFGPETARALEQLVARGAGRDTLAAVALRSRDVFARIEFLRDVGMDRFLDVVRTDMRRAMEQGIISRATLDDVSDNLPRWYRFLEERGVWEGDSMLYRIRGDTLRSMYRATDGEWLLDQLDVGPERGLSVLGSYFARGSSFRAGLLDSMEGGGGGCDSPSMWGPTSYPSPTARSSSWP